MIKFFEIEIFVFNSMVGPHRTILQSSIYITSKEYLPLRHNKYLTTKMKILFSFFLLHQLG